MWGGEREGGGEEGGGVVHKVESRGRETWGKISEKRWEEREVLFIKHTHTHTHTHTSNGSSQTKKNKTVILGYEWHTVHIINAGTCMS